jgi:cytochrome c biogenesis protein CcdA/thiol-disulfide isomerase/thioredoxin
MQTEFINIGLGFLEGIALVISPCILPILPIILSGSLTGGKKRPIGIISGFILIFSLFTLFSRKLVELSGIDLNLVRNFSFYLLIIFGAILISTKLSEIFSNLTQKISLFSGKIGNKPDDGFFSGILFGSIVALIWTPCAGPILATVILQSILQKTTLNSFFIILSFGIGTSIPMLLITFFGKYIIKNLSIFKRNSILIRRVLGIIIISSVGFIYFGDKMIFLFSSTPNLKITDDRTNSNLLNGIKYPYLSPQIAGIQYWINSNAIHIDDLKGKVVLIDFWAYSCINCIRTIPYLNDWFSKYNDKGFIILGIHSPEFDFERDLNNVTESVHKNKIKYPIALDNSFITWQNFNNLYWPAHYLIDKNGYVVYEHFGEGKYDITENNIRFLLGLNATPTKMENQSLFYRELTPETYLGSKRVDSFLSPESILMDEISQYTYPKKLQKNGWALNGKWIFSSQKIISAQPFASIKLHFLAKNVFAVIGSKTGTPIQVKIKLDGENIVLGKGDDVINSSINVIGHTLYNVVSLNKYGSGLLEITALEPGLEFYSFTFGD